MCERDTNPASVGIPLGTLVRLPIEVIRLDFQEPAFLFDEKVAEIAAAFLRGEVLPPVVVRYDGATYQLQDGFHRIAAMVSIGRKETEAEVIPGTLADMQAEFERMIREHRGKWGEHRIR